MRRIPALLLLAVAAVLVVAAPAAAHTELVDASPTADATAPTDLEAVVLTFSQRVDARLATVAVRHDGRIIADGRPTADGLSLKQPTPELTDGRYDVQWRAAAADGHVLSGSFGFRVRGAGAAPDAETAAAASATPQRLSPAELLREHANGNDDHDTVPSYAAAKPPTTPATAAEDGPARSTAAVTQDPAPADNSGATIVALLTAALGVTTVTAAVERLRRV